MRRGSVPQLLLAVAVTAMAVFVALTIAVTAGPPLGLDSRAFQIVDALRTPWLDDAARVLTKLGLIAIVGSAVLLGAALLIKRRQRARAAALAVGSGTRMDQRVDRQIGCRPLPPAGTARGRPRPELSLGPRRQLCRLARGRDRAHGRDLVPERPARRDHLRRTARRAGRPEPDLPASAGRRLRRPRRSARRGNVRARHDRRSRLARTPRLSHRRPADRPCANRTGAGTPPSPLSPLIEHRSERQRIVDHSRPDPMLPSI